MPTALNNQTEGTDPSRSGNGTAVGPDGTTAAGTSFSQHPTNLTAFTGAPSSLPEPDGKSGGRAGWIAAVALVLLIAGGLAWLLESGTLLEWLDGGGQGIATLTTVKGSVKKKASAALTWRKGRVRDSLETGSSLATGANSRANVRFRDGKLIEIGPNTLIRIDMDPAKGGASTNHLVLTLVRGEITAKRADPAPAGLMDTMLGRFKGARGEDQSLMIKSKTGDSVFTGQETQPLSVSSKIAVPPVAPPTAAATAAVKPTVTPPSPPPVAPAAVEPPPPAVIMPKARPPAPKLASAGAIGGGRAQPEPAPKPRKNPMDLAHLASPHAVFDSGGGPGGADLPAKAGGFRRDPRGRQPINGETLVPTEEMAAELAATTPARLYTLSSLAYGCGADQIPLNVTAPALKEPPKSWVPFVEIRAAAGGTLMHRVYGTSRFASQTLPVRARDLCSTFSSVYKDAALALVLTPGAALVKGGPEVFGKPRRLVLASVGDLGSGPITVHFDEMTAAPHARAAAWLRGAPAEQGVPYRYSVRVDSADRLRDLLPYIAGNGRFVHSQRRLLGKSLHVVRDGRVIASVAGDLMLSASRGLVAALRGTVGFTGERDAFIDLPPANGNRVDFIKDQLVRNKEIKVLTRSRLVTITLKGVVADPDALTLLTPAAEGVFLKGNVSVVTP